MLEQARSALHAHADAKKAETHRGFFKDAGDDRFLGVSAAKRKSVAKQFREMPLAEVEVLGRSDISDERSLSHAILVLQFQRGDEAAKERLYKFYLKHLRDIRDWSGVDDSAPYIAGPWLLKRDRAVLFKLIESKHLWERRVALVTTWWFIRQGDLADTFKLVERVLSDEEDLIHKAAGWMLREAGKKDERALLRFLEEHAAEMPRTMLRYALERLPAQARAALLKKKPRPLAKRGRGSQRR